MKIWYFENTHW